MNGRAPSVRRGAVATRRIFIVLQIVALAVLIYVDLTLGRKPNATCFYPVAVFPAVLLIAISSIFVFFFVRRIPVRIVVFVLVLAEACAAGYVTLRVFEWRRDSIELSDPSRAVADARLLIQTRAKPDENVRLEPDELPPSLRLPQLVRAQVHHDHLDLVTASHPDGTLGFRIWAAGATRPHKERPTKYRDVYRYYYHNESKDPADNIP